MTQVKGIISFPSLQTLTEYQKLCPSSIKSVDSNFLNSYKGLKIKMECISSLAKYYIIDNWNSVKNWNNLEIEILDKSGIRMKYYNKNLHLFPELRLFNTLYPTLPIDKFEELDNPIISFENVLLNVDGDLSVDINGTHHSWIDHESVVVIADYIESSIK